MLGKEKSGLVTGFPLELLGENGSRLRASQGTGSGAGEWIYDLLSQHHTGQMVRPAGLSLEQVSWKGGLDLGGR